jgi:peptidoglycan/xylan/chitin deacetylase (PgdA/CDA1 family)
MKRFTYIYIILILVGGFSCSKNNHDTKQNSISSFQNEDIDISNEIIGKANWNKLKKDTVPFIPDQFLEFQKNSNGFCLVYGSLSKKQIALTFDDGPTDVSLQIIELLNKHKAKATFFWVGEKIKHNQKVIDSATNSGHLITNHSWDQKNGISFSNDFLWKTQVEKCTNEFTKHGISDAKYYRPPFGSISQEQIDFLASKNIKTVLWSITTSDWDKTKNKEGFMFNKFKEELHNGAIVLMHDFDFGNLKAKLKDLEKMLIYGRENGFEFVTINKI